MRGWRVALLAAVGCTRAPAAHPQPHARLAVLGLAAPDEAGARDVARALTDELRRLAAGHYDVSERRDELTDMMELASCPNDAPSCIADIGSYLEVDYLIYGRLDPAAVGYKLSLQLMDVVERYNRRAYTMQVGSDLRDTAKAAYGQVAD
jgi:hypothetical protein